eukprot:15441652-Alexandrium_andersonii.AAC.1
MGGGSYPVGEPFNSCSGRCSMTLAEPSSESNQSNQIRGPPTEPTRKYWIRFRRAELELRGPTVVSRRFRICRRSVPASTPEALMGGLTGGETDRTKPIEPNTTGTELIEPSTSLLWWCAAAL